MSDAKVAEQLWVRAHEKIKTGELAQAVRDLAKAYELLKAARDPRIGQVHKRWVEVHKLYAARKKKTGAVKVQADQVAAAKEKARAQDEALAQKRAAEAAARQAELEAEKQRKAEEPAQMSIEQRAETAANQGRLEDAIALYRQVVIAQPNNELAQERMKELEAALPRAQQLSQPPRASAPQATTAVPAGAPVDPGATPASQAAFLEGLLLQVQERRRSL